MFMFSVSGYHAYPPEAKTVPESKRVFVKAYGSSEIAKELSAYKKTASKEKQYHKIAEFISKNQQKLFQELSSNSAAKSLLTCVGVKMSIDSTKEGEFEKVKSALEIIEKIRAAHSFYKEMDRWNVFVAFGPAPVTLDLIGKFISDNQDWFLYNSKESLVVGPQCTDKLVKELKTMRQELERQIKDCNSSIVNAPTQKLVDIIRAIEVGSLRTKYSAKSFDLKQLDCSHCPELAALPTSMPRLKELTCSNAPIIDTLPPQLVAQQVAWQNLNSTN